MVDKVVEELREPILKIQKLQKEQLKNMKEVVNLIINAKIRDNKRIESIFDNLLDITYILGDEAGETYYKLLAYYQNINKAASKDYEDFYLEILNEY